MATRVLLFPGIMGSRLYFPRSGKFWDPNSKMRMLRWIPVWPFRSDDDNRVELHAREPAGVISDNANGIDEDKRFRGWSGVAWDYYSSMLTDLEQTFGRFSTFAVGYDWRQDIEALAGYAESKIRAILDVTHEQKVHIVTHSMGGLVVRAALRKSQLAGGDLASRIGRIVHVCLPAAGAVLLYRRLFTGAIAPNDGNSAGDKVFQMILGNNRNGFQGNFSGLPGAAQLIPSGYLSPAGTPPWNSALPNFSDIATMYRSALSPPGLVSTGMGLAPQVVADLRDRVEDVNEFHAFMGDPATPLHPDTWHVYGRDLATETRTSVQGNSVSPSGDNPGGDGTVPVKSALSLRLPAGREIPTGAEHGGACQDVTVRREVRRLIREVADN